MADRCALKPLLDKLGVQPGARIAVIDLPATDFLACENAPTTSAWAVRVPIPS